MLDASFTITCDTCYKETLILKGTTLDMAVEEAKLKTWISKDLYGIAWICPECQGEGDGKQHEVRGGLRMKEKLKRGTQIIYVPRHAAGDTEHGDCDRGFVITDKGESAFCRYFSKRTLIGNLRTIANSESTPKNMLVVRNTYAQKLVDLWVKRIENEPEIYGFIEKEDTK